MSRRLWGTKKQRKLLMSLIVLLLSIAVYIGQQHGWLPNPDATTTASQQGTKPDMPDATAEPDKQSQQPNTTSLGDAIQQAQPGLYRVTDFVDGDTIGIDMNGKAEKVRMIGVDTPETHDPRKSVQCFGEKAAAFTKTLIGTNNVRLEADPENTNRDKYNRLLRYVFLPDNTLVNAEIIKQGYGFAYTLFPFSKTDEFRNYEQTARSSGVGLWGSCSVSQNGEAKSTNNAQ